jgi:ribose 5-phosphate isomerase B
MKVVIGADHAGFPLKGLIIEHLERSGHKVVERATFDGTEVDFPDIVSDVCAALRDEGADRAMLICGTGIGASMAANKIPGIRAALAHDHYSAHQSVEHDDANVLCLGAQIVGSAVAREIIDAFLAARWDTSDHFVRRLAKLTALETTSRASERKGHQ